MEQKLSISPAALRQLLNSSQGAFVIDVRTKEEYEAMRIPFAKHFPVEEIEAGKTQLDFSKPIVTVCGKGGGRSERAAQFIRSNYSAEAYFLEGGTFGWLENEQ